MWCGRRPVIIVVVASNCVGFSYTGSGFWLPTALPVISPMLFFFVPKWTTCRDDVQSWTIDFERHFKVSTIIPVASNYRKIFSFGYSRQTGSNCFDILYLLAINNFQNPILHMLVSCYVDNKLILYEVI